MQKTVELVPSIYSPSGFEKRLPEAGTHPELTSAEREAARVADRLTFTQACKHFRWTPEQVAQLQGMTTFFPKPIGFSGEKLVGHLIGQKAQVVFSRAALEEFVVKLRALGALAR